MYESIEGEKYLDWDLLVEERDRLKEVKRNLILNLIKDIEFEVDVDPETNELDICYSVNNFLNGMKKSIYLESDGWTIRIDNFGISLWYKNSLREVIPELGIKLKKDIKLDTNLIESLLDDYNFINELYDRQNRF